MVATVKEVILTDNDSELLHSILCEQNNAVNSFSDIVAFPIDTNIQRVPVVGELVYIFKEPGPDASALGRSSRFYYTTSVSLQKNINHNALPKSSVGMEHGASSGGYAAAAAGNPSGGASKEFKFDFGFEEVADLSQLQPFSGDILIEGRFGQSIRQGYTPSGAQTSLDPTWNGPATNPITIIRNTQNTSGWNSYVIEDVNDDDTSIWLTSGHQVPLSSAHDVMGARGITPTEVYTGNQIIGNSDRIVLNAKTDSVAIIGKGDVNISTPVWKAAMDNMFTQIEEIKNELNELTAAVSGFAGKAISNTMTDNKGGTGVNIPISSGGSKLKADTAAITARIAKITTELNLMKQ